MLIDRMIRAARLDVDLYEEVERDESATTEALLAVVIVSLASGIGAATTVSARFGSSAVIPSLAGGVISALIGWLVTALLTYWIGTAVFGGTATYGELLRTIGFATSPLVLRIFAFIPICGGLIVLAASIWWIATLIVAIRQALDFTTGRAIGTALVAWIVGLLAQLLLLLLTGVTRAIF